MFQKILNNLSGVGQPAGFVSAAGPAYQAHMPMESPSEKTSDPYNELQSETHRANKIASR